MNDRMNTTFGWILGAGIVALGGAIVSSMYFKPLEAGEGEGYFIEGAEEVADAGGPSWAELLENASVESGQNLFSRCSACHTIAQGGPDGIGPNLYGIMGSPIGGHSPGFGYSSALADIDGNWDFYSMSEWLANPAAYAPGTLMTFAGLSDPQDRVDVTMYMLSNGGDMGMYESMMAEAVAEAEAEAPAEGEAAEEGAEEAPAEEGADEAPAEEAAAE